MRPCSSSTRASNRWPEAQRTFVEATVGHRSTTICHLINICRELGRKLQWAPVKEELVDDTEANALRCRSRRKGYELPEV